MEWDRTTGTRSFEKVLDIRLLFNYLSLSNKDKGYPCRCITSRAEFLLNQFWIKVCCDVWKEIRDEISGHLEEIFFSFFASHFSRSLSKCRNNISITINSQGCKDQIPKIVIMKIPMHHELPSNIVVIADHVANSSLPAELSRVHWDSVWILPCPRKMPKFTSLDALSLNVPLGCKFSVRDRDT